MKTIKKQRLIVSICFISIGIALCVLPIGINFVDLDSVSGFTLPEYYKEHFNLMNIRSFLILFLIVLFFLSGLINIYTSSKYLRRIFLLLPISLLVVMIALEFPFYRCSAGNVCRSFWNLLGGEYY